MDLETARPKEGIVNHVLAVGHANEKDVVEGVDAIDLGQQLVDNRVGNAGAIPDSATALADGIHLVEDDNVQHGVISGLELLLLGLGEQFAHLLLRSADVLVEDFGSVDDLGLPGVQDLANLPRDERLAAAGRAVQEHAAHVVDAQLPDDVRRPNARREGPAEDLVELGIQPTNAELLEVKVRKEDVGRAAGPAGHQGPGQLQGRAALGLGEGDGRRAEEQSHPGPAADVAAALEIELADGRHRQLELAALEVDGQDAAHLEHLPLEVQQHVLREAVGVDLPRGRPAAALGGAAALGEGVDGQLQRDQGKVGRGGEGPDLDLGAEAVLPVAPVQAVEGDLVVGDGGVGVGRVRVGADRDEGEGAAGFRRHSRLERRQVVRAEVDAVVEGEAVLGQVAHLQDEALRGTAGRAGRTGRGWRRSGAGHYCCYVVGCRL
mmetsp:Transcript_3600/g.10246  ORF Transcript_3600/g.10246 Transcript_3600/m.10246 type:complete len:435 (-) Transcript_3600:206-1510(-)